MATYVTYATYSVEPFSLWKTDGTKVKGITGRECAICGKQVREPFKHVAIVIDGGAEWGTLDSDRSDSGYMGEHPIGPDCHKKYRVDLDHSPQSCVSKEPDDAHILSK